MGLSRTTHGASASGLRLCSNLVIFCAHKHGGALLFRVPKVVLILLCIGFAGCSRIVAKYDPFYDQTLNKFSEDTAKFLAAAQAGKAEREWSSKETVTFYAAGYNTFDRLSQRAALERGLIRCSTNAQLQMLAQGISNASRLPDDYMSFDCLEFQLFATRLLLDDLKSAHASGGVLTAGEARAYGVPLQVAILGAIRTFDLTRP
jgi:hypothetical protein